MGRMMSTEATEKVADGLTALADIDLDGLCDEALNQLVVELQGLTHRLAAEVCRVTHRWEQRGVWAGDGSKSSTARLARDGHITKRTAHALLWLGRRLDEAPVVAAAFAAGELSADQADMLLQACSGREALFARDEQTLVDQACELRVGQLARALTYWSRRADAEINPDGPEPKLPTPVLTLTPIEGAVAVNGELDPVGGRLVSGALEAIADELQATHPELERAQLRALALVEMARRALAMPAGAKPARILANIACGEGAFAELCELADGTVIQPGHLVPYLGASDIRSILYDAARRAVAVSQRRTFVGSLRSVIEVRDLHCQHPSGCDEPIDACDVDHIIPVCQGGVTSQDNGRLMCTFHNRIEPHYARPPAPTASDP